jgi:UDP-2,3-diacylglucosamine pyrophosphatase LpxH
VSSPERFPTESLLVFSDVHLGSDIQDGAARRSRRSSEVDRDLVRLLMHYRAQPPTADRWRIVIAGDFIDFIGMTIAPREDDALETALTPEERQHGLGGAADHARLKLRRVAARHADVFAALAAFVADGHALSIVHGNHDIEFYWDAVKSDFRDVLFAHAQEGGSEALDRDAFLERIEFNPWFFYRDGVAYIEHGHQYDPFCATEHIMAPLSPADPRRVARAFCDILLRFVVRPMGMKDHGHEDVGPIHYLRLGARLGLSGMIGLGVRFAGAVGELFRLRRAHLSEATLILKAEHEARVAKLAEAKRIGVDRLRALLLLQAPPLTISIRGILAGVLLDRLALALAATAALVALAIYSAFHGHALWAAGGVLVTWSLLNRWLSSRRKVDPTENMVERAAHLARLFPAAFVVMGHTHVPVAVPAGAATYVNVGSWAEDAADDEDEAAVVSRRSAAPYRAARTHLVIHVREDRPVAQFCTWEETGPQPRILPELRAEAPS